MKSSKPGVFDLTKDGLNNRFPQFANPDHVPSDFYVARFSSGMAIECLDFSAPHGVGIEDLRIQGSHWNTSAFDPLININEDALLDLSDLFIILDHLGAPAGDYFVFIPKGGLLTAAVNQGHQIWYVDLITFSIKIIQGTGLQP